MPARFREAFKGGVVLNKGYDPCIVAFPPSAWQEFSRGVAALSMNLARARRLRRITFGGAFEQELDRQGRVLLPQALRRYAAVEEQVVIVGAGEYLEVWDALRWQEELARIEETASRMAESVEERKE